MRLHLDIERAEPLTRRELAEIALNEFGPIRTTLVCRRHDLKSKRPDPLARWVAKIRALEINPGPRALADLSARQLCDLLKIRIVERNRFELDFREIA